MYRVKQIEDYSDYFATSDGDIISHKFGKNKKLIQSTDNLGYLTVKLCSEHSQKTYRVHRLVAYAFIGIPRGMTVNHKNCDKKDNRINNLEIVTLRENLEHSFEQGRHSHPKMPIMQIDFNENIIGVYESQMEAQRQTGIGQGHIGAVIRGERKSAGGYLWRMT